jgi:hypothetical protein
MKGWGGVSLQLEVFLKLIIIVFGLVVVMLTIKKTLLPLRRRAKEL